MILVIRIVVEPLMRRRTNCEHRKQQHHRGQKHCTPFHEAVCLLGTGVKKRETHGVADSLFTLAESSREGGLFFVYSMSSAVR